MIRFDLVLASAICDGFENLLQIGNFRTLTSFIKKRAIWRVSCGLSSLVGKFWVEKMRKKYFAKIGKNSKNTGFDLKGFMFCPEIISTRVKIIRICAQVFNLM